MIAKRVPARRHTSDAARLARYVVNAKGGVDPRSWSRTADYILDSQTEMNERGEKVGGVRVTNCGTDDPAAATLLIQATQAINTRSKGDKTYHLVFSFPPGEQPSLPMLNAIEDELCASIGFADHQRISAVHIDTDHLHVHVAINKVHPIGFQNIEPHYDKRRLMKACARLEVQHGLQQTNHGIGDRQHEKRERIRLGPQPRSDERDTRFRRYLRESYDLPLGQRPEAKTLNGLRNLSGCRLAHATPRASMLLPDHARAGLQRPGEKLTDGMRWTGDGHRADGRQHGRTIGADVAAVEAESGIETLASYVVQHVASPMREAKNWQNVHDALATHGLEIKPRGAGLVIGDGGIPLWVRASQCGRDLAYKALTDRLGPFVPSIVKAGQEGTKEGVRQAYVPRPVQQHPSTAQLFAQYQRERQATFAARKKGIAQLREEQAAHGAQLKTWQRTQRALTRISTTGAARKLMAATLKSTANAARQKQRIVMQERRQRLHKELATSSWADWLARQAEQGNVEALAVLRSRSEQQQKLQGDLLTAQHAERAKAIVFKALKPHARRDGSVMYHTIDGGMVIDRARHVQAQTATTGAALVALSLAAEKFSDQPLIVEGTDEFKRDVARLAALHKINVTFADPAMESVRNPSKDGQAQAATPSAITTVKSGEAVKGNDNSDAVDIWIESRNTTGDKVSSINYHRRWQASDVGAATYQGRRRMDDGSEVLLLKRGDEMLVKPASAQLAAKASAWKVGRAVQVDARGRFLGTARTIEL